MFFITRLADTLNELNVKLPKCELNKPELQFLGHFYTQRALTSCPVLALLDNSKQFEVGCVTSITGIGAALTQKGRPVAFESKMLSPAERNYTAGEQDLFAVVHTMRTWQCCLEGVKFTVITDH